MLSPPLSFRFLFENQLSTSTQLTFSDQELGVPSKQWTNMNSPRGLHSLVETVQLTLKSTIVPNKVTHR